MAQQQQQLYDIMIVPYEIPCNTSRADATVRRAAARVTSVPGATASVLFRSSGTLRVTACAAASSASDELLQTVTVLPWIQLLPIVVVAVVVWFVALCRIGWRTSDRADYLGQPQAFQCVARRAARLVGRQAHAR
jgi:hypothetical protein